jgi:hypothetical protein
LGERSNEALVDSGTTFVYFPTELYNSFKLLLASVCRRRSETCAKTSDFQSCYTYNSTSYPNIQDFFDTFPPITVVTEGVELLWEPREYMFQMNSEINYCLAIYPLEDIVLGAAFMRNFDIKFDTETQRIGFARANCDGSRPPTSSPQSKQTRIVTRASLGRRKVDIKIPV